MADNRGRAPFILSKLSYFTHGVNGEPPIVPYNDEFCYDDLGDKSIGFVKYRDVNDPSNKSWDFVSVAKDLNTFITNMKNGGVFDNALAGSVSRDLTYFTYDSVKASIILNQNLVFPHSFKYYAIRTGYEYVTGRLNQDGSAVQTNLCGMKTGYMLPTGEVVGSTGGSTTQYDLVSKPMVGQILTGKELIDGDPYIVEFFDDSKKMVQRDVYFAENVQTLTGDDLVVGDLSINRIEITSSRTYNGDPNSVFLYRQESPEQLANSFIIRLVFTDGSSMDVTHEFSSVGEGRGRIIGLDNINTSIITQVEPSSITFEYTPISGGDTIIKQIKVYIIEDNLVGVNRLIPFYTVKASGSQDTLIQRYIALMNDNSYIDVTGNIVPNSVKFNGSANYPLGSSANVEVTLSLATGYSGQSVKEYSFHSGVYVHTGTTAKIFYTKDLLTSPDRNYSFSVVGNLGAIGSRSIASNTVNITDENKFVKDGQTIIPTHFRIRNMNGTWFFTNPIAISSFTEFTFTQGSTSDSSISQSEPLVIEFFDVTTDESGNTVYRITNVRCAYYKSSID